MEAPAYATLVPAAAAAKGDAARVPRIPLGLGPPGCLPEPLEAFFRDRGWTPWPFQRRAWASYAAERSGLIHIPTGAGKTYAAFFGALAEMTVALAAGPVWSPGLRVLYITPLRAVARDIEAALRIPIDTAGLPFKVESRTGDSSSSTRTRQRDRLPEVLVTTPESLSLMLTRPEARQRLASIRLAVIDEWHELLTGKRGTQVELALSRLRAWAPSMRTWALSATLSNLAEAAQAAVGVCAPTDPGPDIISSPVDRPVEISTLLPDSVLDLPWAGHLGLAMLPRLDEWLDPGVATLIFVNTRSQCERWFHALLAIRPDLEPIAAIHHGSIDRDARERCEAGLKDGSIRIVVATSSLDLGVDFSPVERVVQIGSPKGIARLLQRAGRSGHRPGAACRILCVPTSAMEVVEVAAVRDAVAAGRIEPRAPQRAPIDVLAQHMVTCAIGGGFDPDELYREVRTTMAYRDLPRADFDRALSIVTEGGGTLRAYPDFCKVAPDASGRMVVPEPRIARIHRLNVGTIVGDATADVAFANGRRLGSIEEGFIAGLRRGQRFFFAGRTLEFVGLHDTTAIVRPSRARTNLTPIWSGTRLPISEPLSDSIRAMLVRADSLLRDPAQPDDPAELIAALPILAVQARLSHLPARGEVLAEICRTRQGRHAFIYPFEGRLVHAGLAAILALRLARLRPATISVAANDYGLELLADRDYPFEHLLAPALFDPAGAAADTDAALSLGELARRQFREVARIAGLVPQSYPGLRKKARQIQASSGLIYDVLREFDPENALLRQARREVLERHFELDRLGRTMARLAALPLRIAQPSNPTPLSLPLVIEREAGRLSTQSLAERVRQITRAWSGQSRVGSA